MVRYLSIIVFLFFSSLEGVVINQGEKNINEFKMEHYYDESRSLDIEHITKKEFHQRLNNQFTLGYTKGNNWFKIDIVNNSDNEDFIIYINEPFFEDASLFYFDNYWKEYDSGLFVPLKNRVINDSNPAFPVSIKKGERKIFYIKTYAKLASFAEVQIYEYSSFITHYKLKSTVFYMFYFGGLFIIIVLILFLYLRLNESIYLFYTLYTFFYAFFIFIFSGINISVGLAPWHYELHAVTPLFIFFFILFSIQFIETRRYAPNIHKILIYFAYIHLILAGLNFINVSPWYEVVSTLSSLAFILLIYLAIKAWLKGHKKAKYYLFALSIYMVSIMLLAFMVNGWIENNDINRYSFLVGSFIEVLLFTLMLANRFNEIKNEKLKVKEALIELKNKNEAVLEEEVRKRTQELSGANKELKKVQDELKDLNSTLEEKISEAIKDIKYKEKLLEHQSRLAQMGEMISMIAHQWRQPLGAIASAVLSVQTKLRIGKFDFEDKNSREEFLEILEKKHRNINDYVQYLSSTVNDFRDSFKPDTNKEWISILTPVNKSLEIMEKSLKNKGIDIVKEYACDELVEIYQNEMMQVILNILKNSKDNFEDKGLLKGEIRVDVKKEVSGFYIIISDNGGGIDDEIIDKVFDPYFSTKLERNGTGLGLYMSKVMIEEHMGGKLNVYNTKKGVSFEIILNTESE